MIAALGRTLGTAIGAMLPATSFEAEKLGPYGNKKLRDTAGGLVKEGVEGVKEVAAETYGAVKEGQTARASAVKARWWTGWAKW